MERLVVEIPLGRIVLVRLVHVPHHRTIAMHHVGMPAGGISQENPPGNLPVSRASGRISAVKCVEEFALSPGRIQCNSACRFLLSNRLGAVNGARKPVFHERRGGKTSEAGSPRRAVPRWPPAESASDRVSRPGKSSRILTAGRFQPLATDQCQPHHPARPAIHHALSRWSQSRVESSGKQGHTIGPLTAHANARTAGDPTR
ncbi:MAG: hypothetical protein Ct9H300mP1_35320 [Planctomycetaceae bacterium]|nr:MAG: hypothetical protein Ct9H300mP1_35320 [Planctomycetaceae bacterium]